MKFLPIRTTHEALVEKNISQWEGLKLMIECVVNVEQ